MSIAAFIVAQKNGITFSELGFTSNFKKTLLPWSIMTFGLLLLLAVAKYLHPGALFVGILTDRRAFIQDIPIYLILGAFLQEFLFRGYFFARVKSHISVATAIVLNIIIFSLFHLPLFFHFESNLLYLSIVGGILWSIYYAKYPNLYLAWASHAVVGEVVMVLFQKF